MMVEISTLAAGSLGLAHAVQHLRQHQCRQHAHDHNDNHDFDQRETAGAAFAWFLHKIH